jgi:SAM-dependent methyltransferase
MVERTAAVVEHYGRDDLRERLSSALRTAGLSGQVLSPMILAPLDQFHVRGLAATKELAEAARVGPGAMVLDVGSGLGGPSRYLAATYGCHVTGIDLNASFVEAATYLAERAGFVDQVAYECADALALPYDDGRFDIAWTQHVAMNIEDRARLYGEVKRVLRPGGRFAVYDVVVGSGEALHFPVPWARNLRRTFCSLPTRCGRCSNNPAFASSPGSTGPRTASAGLTSNGMPRQPPEFCQAYSGSISRWALTSPVCLPISAGISGNDGLG